MTSRQSLPDDTLDDTPDSSPSYSNTRFLWIGLVVVLVALGMALIVSVRASAWWFCVTMALYALARLVLPESGKYEGLAVRSKFLDVSFLTISSLVFAVVAMTAPTSM